MADEGFTRREALAGVAAGTVMASTTADAQTGLITNDLTELTIVNAAALIAERAVSPVELTRAYLDRIERLEPQINAYVTVTAETALEEARAAEREIMAGKRRGVLHGIPIALKDNIDTKGVLTTAASKVYANRVPTEDAEAVRKLRAAGAVFLGKLNMHEFAYGGTTAITSAGPTHNPWNLAYNPGGSSGGSAAAVAARMCAGALGTDTAASIRLPAAFCGVTGLKPTHGLASIRGIVPLSEMHDHAGPICRSAMDCEWLMNGISGFDPLDPVSIRAPEPWSDRVRDVSRFRIGVPRSPFWEELNPDVAAACEDALKLLATFTAGTREVKLTFPDTFQALLAEIYAYHAKMVADPKTRRLYDPITLGRIMDGAKVPAATYIEQRRQMAIARNTVNDLFNDVDVLVTPTCMVLPRTIDDVLTRPVSDLPLLRNTLPYNVLGIPAISVPCGFSKNGLPIGLQIAGPRLGEAKVLAFAHAYQRVTEWHTWHPPIG